MKTLTHFLKAEGAPSLTKFAADIGVSKARLSQLRNSTEWPADLAMEAEKVSGGALSASTLSPVVARARAGRAA